MDDMTFDEAAFQETQERLDLIRSLETKYGKTIPEVLQALEEKKRDCRNWRITMNFGNRRKKNWNRRKQY